MSNNNIKVTHTQIDGIIKSGSNSQTVSKVASELYDIASFILGEKL